MKRYIKKDNGGLTVEATLVLPMFMIFIMTFIYIIQSYCIYGNVNIAMYSAAGQLSGKVYKDNMITKIEIEECIKKNLSDDIFKNIYGGIKGIDVKESFYNSTDDEVYLKSRYEMCMPIGILKIGGYEMRNTMVVRGWTGNRELLTNKNFVYITKTGKVYHTDIECSYLSVRKISVLRQEIDNYRNESKAKYYECKECRNEKKSKYVYITKYGTSYHNIKMCSSITRNIIPIDIQEIEGRDKCEKCCGRQGKFHSRDFTA